MFSTRVAWSAPPNAMSVALEKKRKTGAGILDLTQSNPTRAGLQYRPDFLKPLSDPRSLLYEPAALGHADARAAVAEYYASRGFPTNPSSVAITASSSEAYSFLFKLHADPGEEILVPSPSYPLFEYLASLEGVATRAYPLRYDGAWHIDFDALKSRISPATRAIVLVNPNNPTGSYIKKDELGRLLELGLPLISDEVFADYSLAADSSRVTSLADAARPGVYCLGGLSKFAGLPQLKLGWIRVSDPESIERLELIADTYLSVATPVQLALPALLAASGDIHQQIRSRTAGNLAMLEGLVRDSPVQLLRVEGGWSASLRVPRTLSEEHWTLSLLDEDNVLVQPGYFFDFESEAFLVVSLLCEPDVLREGIARLVARVTRGTEEPI